MISGDVFNGEFRIEHVLGEGGFATVYSALDPNGQRVALKVLKPDGNGGYAPATRARFEREVDLVGRLRSPYVVRLHGFGTAASGELYAVFEHIGGRDLAEMLKAVQRLESRWVLHILQQLLHALKEAHRRGLLHRDLKPENVRIFERGDDPMAVKLLDFGIARATDDGHPAITRTGELIGTPKYMSPEQLLEQPLKPASDIYSLGVMMFELLVGRDAMGGHSWGAQLERLHTGYTFNVGDMGRVGAELLGVLQRMTARDPAQRFQNIEQVQAALEQLGPPAPSVVSGFDATVAQRAVPSASKPSGRRALMAAGVVLVGAGVLTVALRHPKPRPVQERGHRASVGILKSDLAPERSTIVEPRAAVDVGAAADAGTDMSLDLPPEDPRGGTPGCGKPPPFTGGGTLRGRTAYPTYVPRGYRQNYKHPLILLLHQDEEHPADLLAISGFPELSEPDHFIIVAPDHPKRLLSAWRDDEDDLPLLRGGYEVAAAELCLDPKRVFVIGNGNAGRAASFASCTDWVAGTGTFAFSSGNASHHCLPSPPKPFVVITTTHSPHAPLHGGAGCTPKSWRMLGEDDDERPQKFGVQDVEKMWTERNRCDDAPATVREVGDHTCYTWNTCQKIVHSCHVVGGHGWPGSEPRALRDHAPCDGPPPTDFAVAREFWEVFRSIEPK